MFGVAPRRLRLLCRPTARGAGSTFVPVADSAWDNVSGRIAHCKVKEDGGDGPAHPAGFADLERWTQRETQEG